MAAAYVAPAAAASLAHQSSARPALRRAAGLPRPRPSTCARRPSARARSATPSPLARAAQASVTSAGIARLAGHRRRHRHLRAGGGQRPVNGELQAGSYVFSVDRDYADNHAAPHRAAVRACALRQEPGDERGHLARGRRCRPQVACDRLQACRACTAARSEFVNGGDEHGILRSMAQRRCRRWARRCG